MSVQHHLLSLSPEASCAVTLFREGRRDTVTAVITELPDHSGLPAERSFPDIAHKVRRMFLRDADARQIAWVYRRSGEHVGKETIFQVQLGDTPGCTPAWIAMTSAGLSALVNRGGGFVRRVFFPEFRTPMGEVGRRRPKEVHDGVPV